MSVVAERFSVLDKETNVAIASVKQLASDAALNNRINDLKEATTEVKDLLASGQQIAGDMKAKLDDAVSSVTDQIPSDLVRKAKDAYSQVKNVAGLGNRVIDKAIAEIIPGNKQLQGALSSMSARCKTSALSRGQFGKPYNPSMTCNGSKRPANSSSCNSSTFSDMLDKLTGGSYSSSYRDANSTLNGLMALSNLGYSMNMCGVLGALVNGGGITDMNLVSRAGAGLLGILGSNGNANGVFDLAKYSAMMPGLKFVRELPNGVGNFMANFKTPIGFDQTDTPALYDLINTSTNELDANWDKSGIDDNAIQTLAEMDTVPDDLKEVMEDGLVDDFSIDGIPDSDDFTRSAAMVGTDFDFIGDEESMFDYAF